MIYKYYPLNYYTIDALVHQYLYFNKVSLQNDPYDASGKLIKGSELEKQLLQRNLDPNYEQKMSDYSTCSFSRSCSNKLLWAYYAKEYSGICVKFDESLFSDFYAKKLGIRVPLIDVNYVESIDFNDLKKEFEINSITLEEYCKKCTFEDCLDDQKKKEWLFTYLCSIKEKQSWATEDEVRLIASGDISREKARLKNKGVLYMDGGYKLPMPPNCIKEIYVGHNLHKKYYSWVRWIARCCSCNIYVSQIRNPFNVDFVKFV